MGRQVKRKRKVAVAVVNEEKENESETSTVVSGPIFNQGPMYKIMSHVQTSEALHKKYVKEMQQLYTKMNHSAFLNTFIHMIKVTMACDESNEYAMTTLQFCAKFIGSYDGEETHPLLTSIFDWLLQTISNNPHIRYRLCQFINMVLNALGPEAALDDAICDKILEYMVDRLLDVAPNVRVQAVIAMQRLQVPENPDDAVVNAYKYHLCSDPSPRVRIAVINCLGRNYLTIPYVLDRLWDIDEKVRRHTYLSLSSYAVRSYKVSQRLTLLEQGLNDRSEAVRKVVSKIMLQQWFESYQKDLIQLIGALKLDANEADIERFRKVTKQMLLEIFQREDAKSLVELLPLDPEWEFHRCVPHEQLTMENVLYWQCLSEFLQSQTADEYDLILPELSIFCTYIEKFCELHSAEMDKYENMEFQYKLLSLLEILHKYDLGDEIGRGNLKKLIIHMLKNVNLDEKNIGILIRCAENIIPEQNERMQLLVELVSEICDLNHSRQSNLLQYNEALKNCTDSVLKMQLAELKMKILELEEKETNLLQAKNFEEAQKVTEEKNTAFEEYTNLIKPLLPEPLEVRKLKNENILSGLHIIFHMIVSKKVRSLSPQVCKLYYDFVCRHMVSVNIPIRDWAFKCSTAFSMHYEPIAKEVINELYSQFSKNHIVRIWETSVKCIFEILDLYGIDAFSPAASNAGGANNTRRAARLLYNTLETLDCDDEPAESLEGQAVGGIYLMSHFLDNCDNATIVSEIVLGFIRLIVHGHINNGEIMDKLFLRYFNPSTNTKINQYLSIFIEEMIRLKKQKLLIPSLLPTVNAVMSAPYDSPLLEIRPDTITRFFVDITRQDKGPNGHNNLHNKIAHDFLNEMLNNPNKKELAKLLAQELLKLELNLSNNLSLKQEMKEMADKLLNSEFDFDAKTIKHLKDFKDLLDGLYMRAINAENESDQEAEEDTITNENQTPTENPTSTAATTESLPSISETNESTLTEAPEVQATNTTEATSLPTSEEVSQAASIATTSTADDVITSSQQSIQSTTSSQPSTTTTTTTTTDAGAESTTAAAAVATEQAQTTPTITTFGRQNRVGQHCLRRSLNNSRTHSESELSDAPPRIRIEMRIDSEKKKKTSAENTKADSNNKKATSQTVNSTSSRSLRMLGRHQKTGAKSPDANTTEKSKNNEDATKSTNDVSNTSAGATSSSEELNTSEIITQSPNPSANTTTKRILTRRGNQKSLNEKISSNASTKSTTTAATAAVTTRHQTRSQASTQSDSPRKSPEKLPTSASKSPTTAKSAKTKTTTPSETQNSTPKNTNRLSKTPQTPIVATPTTSSKTPQKSSTTATRATSKTPHSRTPNTTTKTISPKRKQARLTPKQIEDLLVESTSDTSEEDSTTKSSPNKPNNKGATATQRSERRKITRASIPNKRKSMHDSSSSSSVGATSPRKPVKKKPSRIPVSVPSTASSRSASPTLSSSNNNFKQPVHRTRSLTRPRKSSRIPRKV